MLDRKYVFLPDPWLEGDWKVASGLPLKETWFTASDGVKLFGWHLSARESPGVLLWCHGNAGNMISRLESMKAFYRRGLSVFLFDYRGYGKSVGVPSEAGLYRDGIAAWDHLVRERNVPENRVVVFGRSLGAAVAAEVARSRPAAGLILEAAFPSIEAVARRMFGGMPAHLLLKSRFPLVETLGNVKAPVLVLHGDRDSMIPFEMGREVFRAAREPKRFYRIAGAAHNDTCEKGGAAYLEEIFGFVREWAGRPKGSDPRGESDELKGSDPG